MAGGVGEGVAERWAGAPFKKPLSRFSVRMFFLSQRDMRTEK